MVIKHVALPLKNDVDYKYSVTLQGNYYTLRFTYSEILNMYTLMITDVDGVKLVSGVGLVPNYPVCKDYIIEGLTGAFYLIPKSSASIEFYKVYPTNLADYYELSYIYDDAI